MKVQIVELTDAQVEQWLIGMGTPVFGYVADTGKMALAEDVMRWVWRRIQSRMTDEELRTMVREAITVSFVGECYVAQVDVPRLREALTTLQGR